MGDFRTGEFVDVAIKGMRVEPVDPWGGWRLIDENGKRYEMPPQAAISRARPAHWPPSPGEVWGDGEGRRWFVQASGNGSRWMLAAFNGWAIGNELTPEELLDKAGPLARLYAEEDVPF